MTRVNDTADELTLGISHQAGEERLHHRQVHREALRREEMSRLGFAAPHAVRRRQSSGHYLPHSGVR